MKCCFCHRSALSDRLCLTHLVEREKFHEFIKATIIPASNTKVSAFFKNMVKKFHNEFAK